MEEKNYKIYCHKNKINNKLYIGYAKNPSARWHSDGSGYKKQEKFYRAIKKHGWNNFEHIILIENLSIEQAKILERYLIKKYNSKNEGYNATDGGEGLAGFHHSEETKQKMSESAMGKPAVNNRPVRCIELKQIFNSAKEAADFIKVAPPSITRVCQHIKPTAGGYHWCYEDEYNPTFEQNIQLPTRSRPIYCITANIHFKNASEAGKWCKLAGTPRIHEVCRGERNSAGKHPITQEPLKWRYDDE